MVDHNAWENILTAVVGPNWHWEMAWDEWKLQPHGKEKKVNFPVFLQRFGAVLSKTEYMSFKFNAIARVFDKVLHQHANLQDTLKMFDRDGNGSVSMKELRKALMNIDMGLSKEETESLLHLFFKGCKDESHAKLETKAFLGRFAMIYRNANDAINEGARTEEQRLMHEAMGRVGQCVASAPLEVLEAAWNAGGIRDSEDDDSPEKRKGSKEKRKGSKTKGKEKDKKVSSNALLVKIERLFELMDKNKNGFLETEEFIKGMTVIPGIFDIRLSNQQKLDVVMLRKLVHMLDKAGEISVIEFMEAFCYEDHMGIGDTLAEHMTSVLFRYRHVILAGCRFFDEGGTMNVNKDDFMLVLKAINAEMAEDSLHFTQLQMEDLCEAIHTEDPDGKHIVAYEDFLSSFVIVDSENTGASVQMTRTS